MSRILFSCAFILLVIPSIHSQTKSDNILIIEENYQGVILSLNTKVPFLSYQRIRPLVSTVKSWEDWLNENREVLISIDHFEKSYCPDVSKNLHKYYRQYISYGHNGEEFLVINAFWKEDIDVFPNWINEYVKVLDGCTYYWRAVINLTSKEFVRVEFNAEN